MDSRVLMLGDAAFTIEFPTLKGSSGAKRVRALQLRIQEHIEQGHLSGVIDIICATRSLSICIDPLAANLQDVQDTICELVKQPLLEMKSTEQVWVLPACYHGDFAPDLDELAHKSGLSPTEVINLHNSQIYDVLFIGFLPGFPFMTGVSKKLHFPRRTSPRLHVPAGSVAIANDQTAIYPWQSPGGWHLLARCPVPLFNIGSPHPSLLSPGDKVRFESISHHDYEIIHNDIGAQRLCANSFMTAQGTTT